MKPKEIIDAVGMIKDEYIEEAAPEAKVIPFPEKAEETGDEKKWRAAPRRRSGWMRYGSVVAAAALLVCIFGITQLRTPDDAAYDQGAAASPDAVSELDGDPSGYSSSGSAEQADKTAEESEAAGTGGHDMINPMHQIDRETMAARYGVAVTLPETAEDAEWFIYEAEDPISEVRFTYEGRSVHFRAQKVDPELGRPLDIESFTGLFEDWDNGVHAVYDNDRGGFYTAVPASEGAAVLYWYSHGGGNIFSLSAAGEGLGDPDECIESLIRLYNEINVEV